jgi:hypothetical protein
MLCVRVFVCVTDSDSRRVRRLRDQQKADTPIHVFILLMIGREWEAVDDGC